MAGFGVAFWHFRLHFFINLALRLEIIGLRKKDNSKVVKRPRMPEWIRFLLGILRRVYPEATSYNQFHSTTMDRWAHKYVQPVTYIKLLKTISKYFYNQKNQKQTRRGRPTIPEYIQDLILCIKWQCPGYSPGKISRILQIDLEVFVHRDTIQKILKKFGYPPNPKNFTPPLVQNPNWKTFMNNQFFAAMDFKQVRDLFGNTLYILNIVDHGTRRLIYTAVMFESIVYSCRYSCGKPMVRRINRSPDCGGKTGVQECLIKRHLHTPRLTRYVKMMFTFYA